MVLSAVEVEEMHAWVKIKVEVRDKIRSKNRVKGKNQSREEED